jgi:excisionase family DNA binding protein
MPEMLTAKDMQDLLQVDRSTIYRMAEAGQLPAVKVGKQWRFPGDMVSTWLHVQTDKDQRDLPGFINLGGLPVPNGNLASILPLDCVQLIQDAFAEALGIMLVVADLDGQPITRVSNPCPLYHLLAESDGGHALCHDKWRELGQVPAWAAVSPGFGGLLCARWCVGNELKGMVASLRVARRLAARAPSARRTATSRNWRTPGVPASACKAWRPSSSA